jgi:hypothetical protein
MAKVEYHGHAAFSGSNLGLSEVPFFWIFTKNHATLGKMRGPAPLFVLTG